MNELAKVDKEILASLILNGDISKLNSAQRVEYVTRLCERVGVDPLTQPFKILELNGKEILYADKGCTQQLCKSYHISTEVTKKEKIEDVYVVTVRAIDDKGRYTDEDGAVSISEPETIRVKTGTWPNSGKARYESKPNPNAGKLLKGDNLCNALMKAVTKAKRRSVLAFCGLGMLDETELETIKDVKTSEIEQPKLEAFGTDTQAMQKQAEDIRQQALAQKDTPSKTKDPKDIVFEPNADEIEKARLEQPILAKDGKILMVLLHKNGWTKEDLKEFMSYTYEIHDLGQVCYKHMDELNKHFGQKKEAK